jgi:small subunit ribosomal protein S5
MENNQQQATKRPEKGPYTPNKPYGDRKGGSGNRKFYEKEKKQYEEKTISLNRVTKVVSGGKSMSFSAVVVIGDLKGQVGYGLGKAKEANEAVKKATENAKKSIIRIAISKADSISHEIMVKFGACKVFLKPAPDGTGIIAGGAVRSVLELAGIKNIYSKVYGSRTKINVVQATLSGLQQLKTPHRIALLRDIDVKSLNH